MEADDYKGLRISGAAMRRMREDPRIFMKEILGLEHTWDGQDEVMKAIAKYPYVAVPSGHALGKDYISAALILWFLFCYPYSVVVATAPTDRQVDMVIWGELKEKFNRAKVKLGGRMLSKYLEVDEHDKWYAIGFTTKDVRNTQGKFQGFHSRRVLVVFSEAQAIDRGIWDQADSLMTAGVARFLAIGNPLVNYGKFYEIIQPGSTWKVVRLDCEKSPNVISGKEIIPGLCSKAWVDKMALEHGVESDIYRMKVKGIPPQKSEDIPIHPAWIEWANSAGMEIIPASGIKITGVDPASMGTDKTVFVSRRGMQITDIKKYEKIPTTEITGKIVNLLNEGEDHVFLDASGGSIGVGIYERLVELGFKEKVTPVNFGSSVKCPEFRPDGRPMTDKDKENPVLNPALRFVNIATQMHERTSKHLENKRIGMPFDEDLNLQLLTRKTQTLSSGKIRLEPKPDYKARGYKSPDESDALDLCMCEPEGVLVVGDNVDDVGEDATLSGMYS
jgi:phage terminase large subunit